MITYYHAVREVAKHIATATDFVVEALREGRVEQEPALTDRMLGAIEVALNGTEVRGVRWRAKTLTDRGKDAQEAKYGADFMGVLSIDLPEYQVSKGFLAQAKLIRNGAVKDLAELKNQCKKMLRLSPASFVFLYDVYGIRIVPAVSVIASSVDPVNLYKRSPQRFFEEHLQCFIGDAAIKSPTPENLEDLRRKYEARTALLLTGSLGA